MSRRVVTVNLSGPVDWFGKLINRIDLKEPTASDLVDYGLPQTIARAADGTQFYVENSGVLRKYFDKCLDVEGGGHILGVLSFSDGLKLKAALLGFFQDPAVPDSSDASPN